MKKQFIASASRGQADHGWLKSNFSFSFSEYYREDRMHFGALRVINDDWIAGGGGFPTHPHRDMEIVTIPLSGALQHRDSTGREAVITAGEVQIMSAGTGIRHSEMNAHASEPVTLLQIWVLPKKLNISPRYDQKVFSSEGRKNGFQVVVSPEDSEAIWINQDAYFSLGEFEEGKEIRFNKKQKENGVYFFLIEGKIELEGEILSSRDAISIEDAQVIKGMAHKSSKLLAIEVPMLKL
jgi:quercetin 2,3-dioxygenase